jgi:SAM-dependent methyltransferase
VTDPAALAPYLRDLARLNRIMLGHRPIIRWLQRALWPRIRSNGLTLLDVGCGSGDLLRAIRHWAQRRGISVRLIGIDISPETIAIARWMTAPGEAIEYACEDVRDWRPSFPVDFIVASLLTHHLVDDAIVCFLRWMDAQARRGWMVYDLQRHAVPYHAIGLAGRLLQVHPMVTADGRISVTRALARAEWYVLCARAGLPDADVRWFAFRWLISRSIA